MGLTVEYPHVPACRHCRDGISACLYAIRDDLVPQGVELLDTLDGDRGRARPRDARARLVEKPAQILNLGLARCVLDGGGAVREHGGHQDVLRCANRRELEQGIYAVEPIAHTLDVAVLNDKLCTHPFEPLKVHIDRTRSDRVSPRPCHACMP
jgi:hypothetical protein